MLSVTSLTHPSVNEVIAFVRSDLIPFAEDRSSYRFSGTVTATVTVQEDGSSSTVITLNHSDKFPDLLTLTSRVMFESILGIVLKQNVNI